MGIEKNEYNQHIFGSAEDYLEIEGKEVRLAIVKANDLYYTIAEAQMEINYVVREYYESDGKGADLARYMHLKNAIQDLNRIYDIALQIPWFLYRIWTDDKVFIREQDIRNKANNIIKNKDNWIAEVEKLCKGRYVKRYLNSTNLDKHKKLYKLLTEFENEYINNEKKETIRDLCNYIKHKGNIRLSELREKTKLNIIVNGEKKEYYELQLIPRSDKMCDELKQIITIEPKIKLYELDGGLVVDVIYDENDTKSPNNFYGKDIIKTNLSFDDMYNECVNYLKAFKPIYDLYMEVLSEYAYRCFPEPKIKNTTEINMNELYQRP